MSRDIRILNTNNGDEYHFVKLEDLINMLKQDGYNVKLKIKKKNNLRATEVIL